MVSVRQMRRHLFGLGEAELRKFVMGFEKQLRVDEDWTTIWYIQGDDTKMANKQTHHVLIMSFEAIIKGANGMEKIVRQFKHLTCACGGAKGGKENATLNLFCMSTVLSIYLMWHFGGGTTDHPSDAVKETKETFQMVMQELNIKAPERTLLYGVKRKPVVKGCNYHVDNLALKHFSLAAYGPTEKSNHSQIHHRQALQTLHDINSHDVGFSNAVLRKVRGGKNTTLSHLHTSRERQERWLSNSDNARRMLRYLELVNDESESVLIAWAKQMYLTSNSEWVRRAAGELVELLLMPEIIVGLIAEDEIGDYFRMTMAFYKGHSKDGSLPGFNTLDFIYFYYDKILPWWQVALVYPHKKLSKCWKYIEANFEDREGAFQKKLLEAGLQAGWKEMAKLTHTYQESPFVFLSLTHPKHAVALTWALLEALNRNNLCVMQSNADGEDVIVEDWTEVLEKTKERRREKMQPTLKLWRKVIADDEDNVLHWFQVLGSHPF